MYNRFLLLLMGLAFYSSLFAQGNNNFELVSDRPGFCNSAVTIKNGLTQIETGIEFTKVKYIQDGVQFEFSNTGLFGTLVRLGLSDSFELRGGAEYLIQSKKEGTADETRMGLDAIMVGAKYQLFTSEKTFADAALIGEIYLPFGHPEFRPANAEPKITIAVTHDLYGPLSLGYNLGTQLNSDSQEFIHFFSINLSAQATKRISFFAESYTEFAQGIEPVFYYDAGITYLTQSNIQADISYGRKFSPGSEYWFIGAGVSIRLPN